MTIKRNMFLAKKSQTGRSMVEMIAVLGIMGILSLGALSGINYVKDKNQANQILKEALFYALSPKEINLYEKTIICKNLRAFFYA